MKTLFADCSYLHKHAYLNTGIQRVVRKFIENAPVLESHYGINVVPVSITEGDFRPLTLSDLYENSSAPTRPGFKERIYRYALDVYVTGRELVKALTGRNRRIGKFLMAPSGEFGLSFLIRKLVQNPFKKKSLEISKNTFDPFDQVTPGDLLLLLDSTWYADIWPSVEKVRNRGGQVVSVIYDLIPITHPQFCDDYLAQVFKNWFMTSQGRVDGYVAISRTVRDDLENFLQNHLNAPPQSERFGYFYLGADFKPAVMASMTVRQEVREMFEDRPVYLIVSTVEPRKNHAYLLDAFDLLWHRDKDVGLLIIGRRGWKVEKLIKRISNHPKFGKNLFFREDIGDSELQYCYSKARALVFPSIAEGFGLPIIEALNNGLPVIASDIPVHREVGKNYIGYCDIHDPESLATLITGIEEKGFCDEVPLVTDDHGWISWEESSLMLFEACANICALDSESPLPDPAPTEPEDATKQTKHKNMVIKRTIKKLTLELNRFDDDQYFLRQAYQFILGRQANDDELQFLQYQLETGIRRKIIISNMLLSPEHAQLDNKSIQLSWLEKHKLLIWKKWYGLLSRIKAIQTVSQATVLQNQSFDRLVFSHNNDIASLEKAVSVLEKAMASLNCQIEEIKSNILYFLNQEAQAQQRRLDQFFFDVRQELRVSKNPTVLDKIDAMSRHSIDNYYLSLEQAYRGSRDEILKRYKATLHLVEPLFTKKKEMRAADLGCGRGEWLQIISGYCAEVTGIDMNSAMVSQCLNHGLNAEQGDLLEWLQRQTDQSLDLVTAFHVIEHLPFEKFNMLIHEIYRVLTYGGSVILETPNPENIHVATHMFYRDPTHKTPVPKELSSHLLEFHGFTQITVHPVHPFENTMRVPEDSEVAKRFNSMVYGATDYLVTGTKQPAKK